jgi:glycerol transport system ATP-binding protein
MTFADQVAVMFEGEIVQTGSPEDLFENPEHRFVGYFIGSPGMNFLECTVEGNVAQVNGASIVLDGETAAKGRKAKGKLELGIRPMYLEVHSEAVDGMVQARVRVIEDLGSYKIVTLMLAGKTLRATLPADKPVPEGEAWLAFPPQRTRLFADGWLIR